MLKRQRPVTPPPSSLGDLLTDGTIRPLHPPYTVDTSQYRGKRQRVRPPPLDGALRGWVESKPYAESDGEEDWIDDARDVPPLSMPTNQYKDANCLLHELHILNQHRLLFVDRGLDTTSRTNVQEKAIDWVDASPSYHVAPTPDRSQFAEKVLVDEVQCVRQRYEDVNRLLGSLFLSRRREVERMACSSDPGPNS